MRIAIAAGGTAGHINPALALAEELRDRGHEVTFFGRPSKLEGTLVPQAGFPLVDVEVTGFDRSRPWTALSSLYRVWSASFPRLFAPAANKKPTHIPTLPVFRADLPAATSHH